MRLRISTASGSERNSARIPLATARGTDPASLPVHAIATRSKPAKRAAECGSLHYRPPGAYAQGFMLSGAPQVQIGAFKTRSESRGLASESITA
jgi:hypothetical protein